MTYYRVNVDVPNGHTVTHYTTSYELDQNGHLRYTDENGHDRLLSRNSRFGVTEIDQPPCDMYEQLRDRERVSGTIQ